MCLLLFDWRPGPPARLVLAANRDEYHARPAAPAAFWEEAPGVLAGRDLEAGGTWLGITRSGRLAALTNVREPGEGAGGARPSRGELVRAFLATGTRPLDYLEALAARAGDYAGFNLVVGELLGPEPSLAYFSNRASGGPRRVEPGPHGLSNAALDTPWPKVRTGRAALAALSTATEPPAPDRLLELLRDRTQPPDAELPDTGVGIELERILGPRFVMTPLYGTRCATVLIVASEQARFLEERFDPAGVAVGRSRYAFGLGDEPGDAPIASDEALDSRGG